MCKRSIWWPIVRKTCQNCLSITASRLFNDFPNSVQVVEITSGIKGRHQNSKDVVTNLPLKLATSGN